MIYIFLDIDGVLNSNDSYISGRISDGDAPLDSKPIGLLHGILSSRDDVRIVLSSSWRLPSFKSTMDNLRSYDALRPLLPYVIDQTPDYRYGVNARDEYSRGDEIQEWLDRHEWDNYAILDDDCDMLDTQDAHFVNTHSYYGLRESDMAELGAILD